jgi:hypothetical protein
MVADRAQKEARLSTAEGPGSSSSVDRAHLFLVSGEMGQVPLTASASGLLPLGRDVPVLRCPPNRVNSTAASAHQMVRVSRAHALILTASAGTSSLSTSSSGVVSR